MPPRQPLCSAKVLLFVPEHVPGLQTPPCCWDFLLQHVLLTVAFSPVDTLLEGSAQLLPSPGENGCHGADFAEGRHSGPWEGHSGGKAVWLERSILTREDVCKYRSEATRQQALLSAEKCATAWPEETESKVGLGISTEKALDPSLSAMLNSEGAESLWTAEVFSETPEKIRTSHLDQRSA